MSNGRTVLLHTPWENSEKAKLKFTFWLKGDTYVLYEDLDTKQYICRSLEWNFWYGASLGKDDVSDEVISLADRILTLSNEYPERYPLCGEHYVFEHLLLPNGRARVKVHVEREALHFDSIHRGIPIAVRMLIAIVVAVIASYIYINIGGVGWCSALFPSLNRITIKAVIYTVTVLGSATVCLLKWDSRNLSDLYLHTLGIICTITTLGALRSQSTFRIYILIGMVAVALLAALPKLIRAARAKDKKRRTRELFAAVKALRIPMGMAVMCTALLLSVLGIVGPVYSGRVILDSAEINKSYSEALANIEENTWRRLTREEKLDTLQIISSWECINVLGVEPALVQTGYLEDNILGEYIDTNRSITVDLGHLERDPVDEVVHTLLHETRHVYQHEAAEMYEIIEAKLPQKYLTLACFNKVVAFSENLDNYIDGKNDYYAYDSQTVEVDSDDYAYWRMFDYYSVIDPDGGSADATE